METCNYQSLKEQMERLKLDTYIFTNQQPQAIQQKIQKAEQKKQKMEEELNNLAQQKKEKLQQIQQKRRIYSQKQQPSYQVEASSEAYKFNPQDQQGFRPPLRKNQNQNQNQNQDSQMKSARGFNNEKTTPQDQKITKEGNPQRIVRNNSQDKQEQPQIKQTPKANPLKRKVNSSEVNLQKQQSPTKKTSQPIIVKNRSSLSMESNMESGNNMNQKEIQEEQVQIQSSIKESKEKPMNEPKYLNPRDKVLWLKEQKKIQEQQKIMEQLNQITKENYERRNYAKEKSRQQYQPSMENFIAKDFHFPQQKQSSNEEFREKMIQLASQNSVDQSSFERSDGMIQDSPIYTKQVTTNSNFQENRKVVQTPQKSYSLFKEDTQDTVSTDFLVNESREVDLNEFEDENYLESLDQQMVEVRKKINDQTQKIENLNETLKTMTQEFNAEIAEAKKQTNYQNNRLEIDDPIAEVEEIDEDQKVNIFNPNPLHKLQERCKLLKYRCEAGIGNSLFQQAYEYLEQTQDKLSNEEIRQGLIEILGSQNIGFWQILDQILYINRHVMPNF